MSRSPLLRIFLALVLAATPSFAIAQEVEGFDASLLTPNTVMAGLVFPHRMIYSPGMELIPHELIKVSSMEQMGIDATAIEQIQLTVEQFIPGMPPNFGAKVIFKQPFDLSAFFEKAEVRTVDAEHNGEKYKVTGDAGIPVGIYQPTQSSVVFATESIMHRVIDGDTGVSPGITNTLLAQGSQNDLMLIFSVDPMRPLIHMGMAKSPPLPPQFEEFKRIPDLISMAMIRLNLSGERSSGLTVAAHNPNEAEKLEQLVRKGFEIAKSQMFTEMAKDQNLQQQSPAMQKAMQTYSQRITNTMLSAIMPKRKGKVLRLEGKGGIGNAQMNLGVTGVLAALLLPALGQVREAANNSNSKATMKNIMLGLKAYEATKNKFPSRAILDGNGKPLLSWRVLMLPYLDAGYLADKFHYDEPWDSPHNIKLLDQMPPILKSPNSKSKDPTKTNYVLAVGKGTSFPDFGSPRRVSSQSMTVALVEVDDSHAVPWTKPDDYDVKHLPKGLGTMNVGFMDGSCRTMKNIDLALLRKFFSGDAKHASEKAKWFAEQN